MSDTERKVYTGKSVKISVSLPEDLLAEAQATAPKRGFRKFSHYLQDALDRDLNGEFGRHGPTVEAAAGS